MNTPRLTSADPWACLANGTDPYEQGIQEILTRILVTSPSRDDGVLTVLKVVDGNGQYQRCAARVISSWTEPPF